MFASGRVLSAVQILHQAVRAAVIIHHKRLLKGGESPCVGKAHSIVSGLQSGILELILLTWPFQDLEAKERALWAEWCQGCRKSFEEWESKTLAGECTEGASQRVYNARDTLHICASEAENLHCMPFHRNP